MYVGAGVHPPAGLKFAINVDVAMSEVFLSNATGRGLNEPLFCGAGVAPVGIRVAVLSPSGDVTTQALMLTLTHAHFNFSIDMHMHTFNFSIDIHTTLPLWHRHT